MWTHFATLQGHQASVYSLELAANVLFSGGGDGWVVSWDYQTNLDGKLIAKVPGTVLSLAYDSTHEHLIVGCLDGHTFWIDIQAHKVIKNIKLSSFAVYDSCVNGDYLYTVAADGYLTQWSLQAQRPITSFKLSQNALRSIRSEGRSLYIGSSDGNIYQFDTEKEIYHTFRTAAHHPSVFTVCNTPYGIASGGRDAKIKLWNNNQQSKSSDAHWYTVNSLFFDIKNDTLISGSRDKTIRIWSLPDVDLLQTIRQKEGGHTHSINKLIMHDQVLISCSDDRTIKLWKEI